MKPSPYFADTFRYFFKRFRSRESLLRWFAKRAGNSSEAFEYPIDLARLNGLLVILPEISDDVQAYASFFESLDARKIPGTLLLSNARHESFLQTLGIRTETLYYTGVGCRYGEAEFEKIQERLCRSPFTASVYLEPKSLFQMLYLAKVCGATYRFGFDSEKFFPLLNLSLLAGDDPEKRSEFLVKLFAGNAP